MTAADPSVKALDCPDATLGRIDAAAAATVIAASSDVALLVPCVEFQVGSEGCVVAVGRGLGLVGALQQRLVEARADREG